MTGTVQFTSNGANLGGTLPLVNSQAKLTTTSLPAGAQQIFANYSGDSNHSSSSASVPETVNLIATTTAVTTSNAAIQQGSSVTFTATVTPIQSGPTLTGTVQFSSGNGNIGTAVNVVNGTAAVTTTTLPAGNLQVQAYYSGDSNYASSTRSVSEQVTAGSNFNISFAPPTVNVTAPGASATTVLTVTGTNGYNGAINFSPASCAGLPSESSCSFSPASVTGSGTTTLTVSTTAPSSLVPVSRRIEFGGWRTPAGVIRLVLLCAAVFALGIQARRRRWNLVGAALVLTLLIANAACGGGGGGGTGPANPGTPKVQNQLITLMATSGTITHTFTFTLNVN